VTPGIHLRPLLVELGATVPARGLYVTEPEFADPSPAIGRWAEAAVPLLRRALGWPRPGLARRGRTGPGPSALRFRSGLSGAKSG
jgi:hypothetical protein